MRSLVEAKREITVRQLHIAEMVAELKYIITKHCMTNSRRRLVLPYLSTEYLARSSSGHVLQSKELSTTMRSRSKKDKVAKIFTLFASIAPGFGGLVLWQTV